MTVRALHILIKHRGSRNPSSWRTPQITLSKEQARQELISKSPLYFVEIEHDLRKSSDLYSDFQKIATERSDCSSAKKGGDLGSFSRGQMQSTTYRVLLLEPFEDAAFSLTPGQMSGIVESDSGLHLIYLLE